MATISTQRQPFGEIGASRLQSLSSAKNCQNAITDMLQSSAKDKTLCSPSKRPFTPSSIEDEEADTENIDPAIFASKRSKGIDGTPSKKAQPLFSLSLDYNKKPASTFDPLPSLTNVPTSPLSHKRDHNITPPLSIPTGSSSAPAGRSPKSKRLGILSRKRTSLSPFKRIEPPSFASGLPFSIDAALSGTLSTHAPPKPPKAPTLDEAMPKGWFFDIYEDSPEEEAANLMEHSTCVLDISSDDEAGPARTKDDRGKENVPPADHVPAARDATPAAMAKPRRSVHADAMVDDGEERAPLGVLPAEDFYGKGLDAASVEVVAAAEAEEEAKAAEPAADAENRDLNVLEPLREEESPVLPPSPSPCYGAMGDADGPGFTIAEDPEP